MVRYGDVVAAFAGSGLAVRGGTVVRPGELEHFPTKWLPGLSKKMRQSKGLERLSDSVGTETALADGVMAATVVLIGTVGGDGFEAFLRERRDELDPMDCWAKRVVDPIASGLGARAAYPSDKPYLPFQRWAQRAEDVHPSPLGLLIHPVHGLWHAYRAALLFAGMVECLPVRSGRPSPCETCAEKPCLSACPVGAFSGVSYDVAACAEHLRADIAPRCRSLGCRARDACPAGTASRYSDKQIQFHMRAFAKARGIEVDAG